MSAACSDALICTPYPRSLRSKEYSANFFRRC
jgi:hypothetical protein